MSTFSEQISRYRERYSALAPREQWLLGLCVAVVFVAVLFLGVWEPLAKHHQQNREALVSAQRMAEKIEHAAARLRVQQGSAAQPDAAARSTSLIAAVGQSSKTGQLGKGPSRIQPEGKNEVRVWFEDVSFDSLIEWAHELETRYAIHVVNMDIEPKSDAGSVNVRLTLARQS